ncbi:GNAT family N-acetyltransferase [Caproicibacter sp. BJN0012]|uniref:GNAT family N-acetyltransferase n=1 Tax=Caproicibacter sp. BJN0012 TaxID=3110227 RepID=UPI002E110FA0|nr:GNAT family N-acetyltransferase [Caproicibacter sp. BJN0012]
MDNIQCYEGNYDRSIFYSKMGRFFAEERYIRQMPYLRNKPEKVWFTVELDGRVVAFSSLEFPGEYILFTTEWVEPRYRRKGLFKALTDARFAYCRDLDLPIKTSTNLEFIRDYYLKQGFRVYRTTKNYWFLCWNKEVPYESKLQFFHRVQSGA